MKREEEIDIVAANNDKAILCECKWRNEKLIKMYWKHYWKGANCCRGLMSVIITFSQNPALLPPASNLQMKMTKLNW